MANLAQKKCQPCNGTVPALTKDEVEKLLPQVPDWKLTEPKNPGETQKIKREFKFPDFKTALDFVNRVGTVAEAEDHHPNIHIFYNRVRFDLTTHVAKGLTENDFIMAAKIDELSEVK